MRKLPITVLMTGLFALLVAWLWPATAPRNSVVVASEGINGSQLNGASRSINESSLQAASLRLTSVRTDQGGDNIVAERPQLSEEQSIDLEQSFAQANRQLSQGGLTAAANVYTALISQYPNFVEPYVNLASVQAELGQLEQARQTLLKGAEANQSTKVLFDSINKLHGALAAQAYRSALETEVSDVVSVSLPKTRDLATDFKQAQQVSSLTKQLIEAKIKQESLVASNEVLSDVRKQLAQASAQISTMTFDHKAVLKSLKVELGLEKEKSKLVENRLALLENDSAKAEGDLVARLRTELSDVEGALRQSNIKSNELIAVNDDLSRQLVRAKSSADVIVAAPVSPTLIEVQEKTGTVIVPPKPKAITNTERTIASNLVKAWAAAWSSQDVTSYLGFYRDDYSSNSNLSHQQWVAQRRVRLTNKKFINVEVRDFSVAAADSGFSVTFTQHYRSNTLDDTIRKRISFTLPGSQSWHEAKISGEKIVSR